MGIGYPDESNEEELWEDFGEMFGLLCGLVAHKVGAEFNDKEGE